MKEIELNDYGVTAMNVKEMKEIDGGCPVLLFFALAALCSVIAYYGGGGGG